MKLSIQRRFSLSLALLAFFPFAHSFAAPVVTVSNTPAKTTFTITNPNVITTVDWSKLELLIHGTDFTGAVASALGTPLVPYTITQNVVTIDINRDLTAFAIGAKACELESLGGACGDSFSWAHNTDCGSTACYEGRPPLNSSVSYPSGFFTWNTSAFSFNTTQPVAIYELEGRGRGTVGFPLNWNKLSFTLNIWSSQTKFETGPQHGDVVNNAPLMYTHAPIGNPTYSTSHVVMRPANSQAVVLAPGSYWVSVIVHGEEWFWWESPSTEPSERFVTYLAPNTSFEYVGNVGLLYGTSWLRMKYY